MKGRFFDLEDNQFTILGLTGGIDQPDMRTSGNKKHGWLGFGKKASSVIFATDTSSALKELKSKYANAQKHQVMFMVRAVLISNRMALRLLAAGALKPVHFCHAQEKNEYGIKYIKLQPVKLGGYKLPIIIRDEKELDGVEIVLLDQEEPRLY